MRYPTVIFTITVLLLSSFFAKSEESDILPPEKGLRVTYLLYSGRPNPSFVIADRLKIKELELMIENLPRAPRSSIARPKLGYSGILVENLSDDITFTINDQNIWRKRSDRVDFSATTSPSQITENESADSILSDNAGIEQLLIQMGVENETLSDNDLDFMYNR